MQRYDSYKDSGVKWLGQIPSHWEVLPGLAVVKENKEKNSKLEFNTVLSLSYGNIIIKKDINEGLVPAEYNTYQIVKPGYIIIRCTDLQNDKTSLRTGLVKNEGIITSAYLGLVVDRKYNAPYIHYFLHTWDITKEIYRHGSGLRQSLSWLDLKRLPILLPPIAEQDAIVTYLDTATAKIDAAILQQQKMIDLLKERKQIIINSAVTRGLDPNVKMKDSGVEWIGMIPETWECRKLKHLLKTNLMYGANESPESTDVSLPRYIRITDIDDNGNLKPDTFCSLSPSKAEPYLLEKGDLLFARSGATAGKTYLFKEDIKACFAGYLIKARLNELLMPEYLNYYTKSGIYDNWKKSIFIQATIPNIGADKYSNLQITLPSKEEQDRIIKYLDVEVDKVDAVIIGHQKQISLLQERKQIIINDVVTGKVKVE